jgi:GNAT superfamily N-acetyltransferase
MNGESTGSKSGALNTRLARPEDLESVSRLLPDLAGPHFGERFPGKTSYEFCRWKYTGNPAGDATVGVALDGDRVVSVVAGTPKRVRVAGEVVLAFELGDFITANTYRNRGLFSKLINLVCDNARQRGAAFAYVRPNDLSFPILVSRLSFIEPKKMYERRYVVPSAAMERKFGIPSVIPRALGTDWILRRMVVRDVGTSVRVEPVTRFDDGVSRLWTRLQDCYRFSLVRDSHYLNWRYMDCPTPYSVWAAYRDKELLGYLAAFVGSAQPLGMVLDLFTHPEDEDAASALVRVAIEALEQRGVRAIYVWTLQDGPETAAVRSLARACFLIRKQPLHIAIRFLDDALSIRGLPSSDWQLTVGDFDGS